MFNKILEALGLTFTPTRFIDFLSYMGRGMLVIFIVIAVIVVITMLTNKIFSGKK